MDRDTAKTLSLVAMIFIIISLVVMVLYLGFYFLMFIVMGSFMSSGVSSFGMVGICCAMIVFLA